MQDPLIFKLKTLFDPERPAPIRRLALVGVAKNCGKTTTLNFLRRSGALDKRAVGMVSVGIDGELKDALLGSEKPAIWAWPGDWIVTARDALVKSSARVEYVESLNFHTPLGEVICARVVEAGQIVLAGLRHREDLIRACQTLENHGVDLVLIDGAYARVVAAGRDVSDSLIISTGAVISDDVERISARTASLVERLTPAPVQLDWQRALLDQAIREGRFLMGGPNIAPISSPEESALLGLGAAAARWQPEKMSAVAIPGLISDSVIETLLSAWPTQGAKKPALLIPDGTALQATPRLLRRLKRRWTLRARSTPRLVALSYNPTGVQGHSVNPDKLHASLHARWPDLPLFNPLAIAT